MPKYFAVVIFDNVHCLRSGYDTNAAKIYTYSKLKATINNFRFENKIFLKYFTNNRYLRKHFNIFARVDNNWWRVEFNAAGNSLDTSNLIPIYNIILYLYIIFGNITLLKIYSFFSFLRNLLVKFIHVIRILCILYLFSRWYFYTDRRIYYYSVLYSLQNTRHHIDTFAIQIFMEEKTDVRVSANIYRRNL